MRPKLGRISNKFRQGQESVRVRALHSSIGKACVSRLLGCHPLNYRLSLIHI